MKIFNDPLKIDGKPRVSTQNENYQKPNKNEIKVNWYKPIEIIIRVPTFLFLINTKIFNDPDKIEGKPKISTKNEN